MFIQNPIVSFFLLRKFWGLILEIVLDVLPKPEVQLGILVLVFFSYFYLKVSYTLHDIYNILQRILQPRGVIQ